MNKLKNRERGQLSREGELMSQHRRGGHEVHQTADCPLCVRWNHKTE